MTLALKSRPMSDDRTDPEAVLIARLQAGDDTAFEEIVRQHQEPLVRFAQRLVGDLDDASDVAQETFIRAYERIAEFRGGSTLYTWLYRIAYNQAISLLRRRRVRRFLRLDREDEYSEGVELQLVETYDVAAKVEEVDLLRHIEAAIETLPPRQRGIFVMRHYEGMSHAQIAQVVGRSEGAIRAGYFHAVRKLRAAASKAGLFSVGGEL
ncbi:MAG TPA: RNA polymerase subunit sigma-70 [Candidatus Latescibacteria bacterium]|jgi:RNA polymerase sigma-70 factor (ECF subfamily)|nr:RNA polymerase subunit sigma-70 [Candidatus Latescibacterota bacterium]|tara:strand:- start:2442 stop:3068 length:627 start_codon:yes stop_codon:yes gene_type:complete